MKIKFDPDLDYQRKAINSVVQIFAGQEYCRADFTGDPVIGNHLHLSEEEVLKNVRAVQLRNGLALSDTIAGMSFTCETGNEHVVFACVPEAVRLSQSKGKYAQMLEEEYIEQVSAIIRRRVRLWIQGGDQRAETGE